MKLFTLFDEPDLTRRLNSEVSSALVRKTQDHNQVETTLKMKSKALGRLQFIKLHLLHKEFSGHPTHISRMLVASGRYAKRSLKLMKIRFWESQ